MPPKIQVNQSNTSQHTTTIPKMYNVDRQTTNAAYNSVGVPSQQNLYSASLRKSKFRSSPVYHTPPRFQRKMNSASREYECKTENCNYHPILNDHIHVVHTSDFEVPLSKSDKRGEKTISNEITDNSGHNAASNVDNNDDVPSFDNDFENSFHSHSSQVHKDLSYDSNVNDSDVSNNGPLSENSFDQDTNLNEEKVDTNNFSSRLLKSNDSLIEGSYEHVPCVSSPDNINTDKTIPVSKIDTSFKSPCDGKITTQLSQTKQLTRTNLISNNHVNNVSGSDNVVSDSIKYNSIAIECDDTVTCVTVSTSDGNTGQTDDEQNEVGIGICAGLHYSNSEINTGEPNNEVNEPRMLSKNESRESIDAWSKQITDYLCSDEHFSRIVDMEWKKTSVPYRGLDSDNDVFILEALIGQVVRFANGAILNYQTKTCKSLKHLLANVYRHYNIP